MRSRTPVQADRPHHLARTPGVWRGLAAGLALLGLAVTATAQVAKVTVKTLAGGRLTANGSDAGYVDGHPLQLAQFHQPTGLAVDTNGLVYVADLGNGAIRRLDPINSRVTTLIAGLNQPIGVAAASASEIYFVTQADGRVGKTDRFGTFTPIASGLVAPTALALDPDGNVFVTEARGQLVRIDAVTGAPKVIATGLHQPGGVAVLDSGLVAVSETGAHAVRFIRPADGVTTLKIGSGVAGFRDGAAGVAQFHAPRHIGRTPGGGLVVADRLNHRVRHIDVRGVVSTVYGLDPVAWEGPECLDCEPAILPGWFDGNADFAEAREPFGVAVGRDGKLYASESYYHILREITGADVAGGSGTGGGNVGGTTLVVLPPTISPDRGFFPSGQLITVVNPNLSSFFATAVYYTTDGTEPTTNSLRLALTGDTGAILWNDPLRDLTSLRLRAYVGGQPSPEVSGKPAVVSEIGVPRDAAAGMGSTLVLPVVVNLRTNDPLKSLQFRVEVTPASPGAPVIPATFDALDINSTNDFFRVATTDRAGASTSTNRFIFSVADYSVADTRGLAITMIGTNANYSTRNFSAVALLRVPVPPNARAGDRYRVEVVRPSGTRDGFQDAVPLTSLPPRFITVDHVSYEVGDTARAIWYNADLPPLGFGDGVLDNADVNNAFSASLGVRTPPPFTDLFDAMDAYPEDAPGVAGGDGLLRFLDWQVVLLRSLGLADGRWVRTWTDGGFRVARALGDSGVARAGQRSSPAMTASKLPGVVWHRQARIEAAPVEFVNAGVPVDVPVRVVVAPGERLAGLAFRISVSAAGAPPVSEPLRFIPAPGLPEPVQSVGASVGDLLCGWSLVPSPAFTPALQGTTLLGHVRVPVPVHAAQGAVYSVRFANVDGAPDLRTQFDLESIPAALWVLTAARQPVETISDEWKVYFFGSTTAANARPDADADGDGISNAAEFQAGTHPADPSSCLHLRAPAWDPVRGATVLRWLSAPGKIYTLEGSAELGGGWTPLATRLVGHGELLEWPVTGSAPSARFYRLRLEP